MKRSLFAIVLMALTAAVVAQDVAFTDVDVFDGEALTRDQTVVVEDGEITAIGPDAQVPEGVETIDGEGRTLLPGLIDSHVHTFYPEALRQDLVFGVTTVLDMFTAHQFVAQMREGQPASDRADLFSAGTLATAPDGHGTQFGLEVPALTSPDQAAQWVDDRIAEGSDYIKIILESGEELGMDLPTLNQEIVRAVVEAAHERDMLVVTHVQTLEAARTAIEAGTDGLAHVFIDEVADAELIEAASEAGIFVIPTLAVFRSIGSDTIDEGVAQDEHLRPFLAQADLQNLAIPFSGYEAVSFEAGLENVRLLHEAGVPILAGTDAMNPGVVYGASLHGELEYLTRAGLSNSEALAAATSVPARTFGLDSRGRIAPGMQADLLLVEGDPTEEITATRNIVGVWKLGVRADRESWRGAIDQQGQMAARQAEILASGEAVVVSDFESGEPEVAFGQPWAATTDVQAGGNSTATMEVVPGGPEGSEYALRVSGEVRTQFPMPWSGVMYMPGAVQFGATDLSGVPVLSFAAQGTPGTYRVQVYCGNNTQTPGEWQFDVSEEWNSFEVDLAEVGGCDVSGVMGIVFSSGQPGEFELQLDEVTLSPRD